MILSLDRSIKLVEEDEGNYVQCASLSTVHTPTATTTTTTTLPKNDNSEYVANTVERGIEAGEYALRARAITAAQGDWDMDMDDVVRASTDTYVLFTVCDAESLVEAKPKKGIFDSLMPDNQDNLEDEEQA